MQQKRPIDVQASVIRGIAPWGVEYVAALVLVVVVSLFMVSNWKKLIGQDSDGFDGHIY